MRERVEERIARKRADDVFLTREFRDLGGEDQVLRAWRAFVREKRLVRLGYGVYGRAVVSRLTADLLLFSANGFQGAALQALTKLGVVWEPTEAERAYNERGLRKFQSIELYALRDDSHAVCGAAVGSLF